MKDDPIPVMCCGCMWFVPCDLDCAGGRVDAGECHRHAPSPVTAPMVDDYIPYDTHWPIVQGEEDCGEGRWKDEQ